MRFLDKLQPLGLLAMRVVLGIIMIGHSYTKVFGGIHKFEGLVMSLGMPWWLAYFATAAEFLGGICVILGLLTRFFSLGIFIDMLVVIAKVHWKNGLLGEHGYQFPLTLATISFALIFLGAGPIALDAVRGGGRGGVAKSRKAS